MIIPFSKGEVKRIEIKNYIKYIGIIVNCKGRIHSLLSRIYHNIGKCIDRKKISAPSTMKLFL